MQRKVRGIEDALSGWHSQESKKIVLVDFRKKFNAGQIQALGYIKTLPVIDSNENRHTKIYTQR